MLKDFTYDIFDLNEINEVENLLTDSELLGFNVTIPYKEKIIDYLDSLSDEAEKIGAVNCVLIHDGKKKQDIILMLSVLKKHFFSTKKSFRIKH